jgi:hypothetical protein
MRIITLTVAAAALAVGFAVSAQAMPVQKNLGTETTGVQPEQVRLVCNRWGRCWHRPGWRRGYYSYGYHPGWRHRYYGYGHRHWHHRRWW